MKYIQQFSESYVEGLGQMAAWSTLILIVLVLWSVL